MKFLSFSILILLIAACSTIEDKDFVGKWKALGGFTQMELKTEKVNTLTVRLINSEFNPLDENWFIVNRKKDGYYCGIFTNEIYGEINVKIRFDENYKRSGAHFKDALLLELEASGNDIRIYNFTKVK